jgi:hypothetical protein
MIKYQPRPKAISDRQRTTVAPIRARKTNNLLPEGDRRKSYPQWPLPGGEEMV